MEGKQSLVVHSAQPVALDGGWGWMCVLGCSLMHFQLGGFGRSYSVIYVELMDKFNTSAAIGSAIGGIFTSIRMGAGPIVSILTKRFSVRTVAIVGAFIFASGALLSAFANSAQYLFFSYSCVSGFGAAMVYFPAVVIVGQYFSKRRGVAMGLSTAGSGIGGMVMPPVLQYLIESYGFTGSFVILSGILLNLIICALLYRPLVDSWRGSEMKKKLLLLNVESVRSDDEIHNSTLPANSLVADGTSMHTEGNKLQFKSENDLNSRTKVEYPEFYSSNHQYDSSSQMTNRNGVLLNNTDESERHRSFAKFKEGRNSEIKGNNDDLETTPLLASNELKTPKKSNLLEKLSNHLGLPLLKRPRFACFVLGLALATMANISSQNLILAHCVQVNVNIDDAVYIASMLGLSDTVGRVLSGFMYDFKLIKERRHVVFASFLFLAGLTLIGWALSYSYWPLALLALANGLFNGAMVAGRPVLVTDIVGVENLSSAFGVTVFTQGIFLVFGPLIAGYLKDVTGNYVASFIFTGLASCLGAVVILLGIFIEKRFFAEYRG